MLQVEKHQRCRTGITFRLKSSFPLKLREDLSNDGHKSLEDYIPRALEILESVEDAVNSARGAAFRCCLNWPTLNVNCRQVRLAVIVRRQDALDPERGASSDGSETVWAENR